MSLSVKCYSLFVYDEHDNVIPVTNGNEFELMHKQEYKIGVANHDKKRRINAIIEIDGKRIGYFRVNANSSICIERPSDISKNRKLTFYALGSEEAKMGAISSSNPNLGALIVTIETELDQTNLQTKLELDRKFEEEKQRIRKELDQKQKASLIVCRNENQYGYVSCDGECEEPHYLEPKSGFVIEYNGMQDVSDGVTFKSFNGGSGLYENMQKNTALGGTALGAPSDQRFKPSERIQCDKEKIVMIAKLVLKKSVFPL